MTEIREVKLNSQQEKATSLIENWFNNETSSEQVFILTGYAGTGKTFLVNYVINNILKLDKDLVQFIAPTGKAASVIIQRGNDACTVHRLIYDITTEIIKTKVDGKTVKTKKMSFRKKISIPPYKLIVLDEVSMVDSHMMEDLLSFGIPVLACGDPGQLRPVAGNNSYIKKSKFTLTEIVRQSENNPIIQLATRARNKLPILEGNYGNVLVLNKHKIPDEIMRKFLTSADQVICGKNSTRKELNNLIRRYLGHDTKLPDDGEKLICTANNWEVYLDNDLQYNLVNGTIGYCKNFKKLSSTDYLSTLEFQAEYLNDETEPIVCDSGIFEKDEYEYDMHERATLYANGDYKTKKDIKKNKSISDFSKYLLSIAENPAIDDCQINHFEYGYAISCHKSQGSEWNIVVLFDESYVFGSDAPNWLYTGITRAKEKLIIIK